MRTGAQVDTVLDLLRARGGRVTSPRRAILETLMATEGHLTAEQLTSAVHDRQPDVDISTVYRFLDELEKMGVIDHVHLGHGPAVYHFADDGHNHLVCESCGNVQEVPAATFDDLRRRLRADFSFELHARHFAVPGRCESCEDEARGGRAATAPSAALRD